ncbi:MAG: hypothetical protein PHT34_04390 [Oscillospiraceae bacterium]|nr:hypothetical protein [Oscillospiraceae bacterium]
MMTKIEFSEAEFTKFFARTFEEDLFSAHEMRLSQQEEAYLRRRYTKLRLTPLSEKDRAGKVWFDVRPEGVMAV